MAGLKARDLSKETLFKENSKFSVNSMLSVLHIQLKDEGQVA